MPRCFVIQPFDDGGPYDKRYKDVLLPAIKDAGLEAYRVDEDRASSIPIDDIENNIRTSEICLADITPDNPNIWYEVGFAFANDKPVVMICAKPRPTKAPFDVQHRHIIFYTLESSSDFKKLQKDVTERLKAQIEKAAVMQTVASLSAVKPTDSGLTSYEVAVMVSIMENRLTPGEGVTPHDIQKDMRSAGYTDIATSLSLESLKRQGLIEFDEAPTGNFNESYTVCTLTSRGLDWMLENKDRFKLMREQAERNAPEIRDEDIPF
jgi:nucleoside 2-deoxyribosyltransferase